MIISTFNVRGLGGRIKKNKIHDLVRKNNLNFLALQETKLVEVTPSLCFSIWGGEDCDWVFKALEGSSGGILSIWRKSCASLVSSFQGDGFVGVILDWGVEKTRCTIINVYSKCDLSAKRILWESLLGERQNREGEVWCVLGDFNVVRSRDERRGVNSEASPS
jgi:exonuclease III